MLPVFIFSWFTVPEATSTLSSIGTWSGALFSEAFPIALIGASLLIGGAVITYFIRMIVKGSYKVVGSGRRGGRRRRR